VLDASRDVEVLRFCPLLGREIVGHPQAVYEEHDTSSRPASSRMY